MCEQLEDFKRPCKEELVDIADAGAVEQVSGDVHATVNCAVLRPHPKLAFDVNTLGTYNAIKSAVDNGDFEFVDLLVQNRAEVDGPMIDGLLPIHVAAMRSFLCFF